jgi:YD repeat-containing protein
VSYTAASQIAEVIDDNGNAVSTQYDTANRVRQVTDAKGNASLITYDGDSNRLTATRGSGLGARIKSSSRTTRRQPDRLVVSYDVPGTTSTYMISRQRTRSIDAHTEIQG